MPARLLILSGDRPDLFAQIAEQHGIDGAEYLVHRAERDAVPGWLSAADAGIAFIRTATCERGSSPVKIGEYLAVGLPVVITNSIGNYSDLIARENIGAVISAHTSESYLKAAHRLVSLWRDKETLRDQCRSIAQSELGLESVGHLRYETVYNQLLGADALRSAAATNAVHYKLDE